MPKRQDIQSILIIGAGPIVIGQACEFDYSGVQAIKALKAEGYRIILVNSNPATIMTDPEFADATYIEPITPDFVRKVIAAERPDALLPTMGGQTALNTAMALHNDGTLAEFGVELIGARAEAINRAEDRQLFREVLAEIGLDSPKSEVVQTMAEATAALNNIGLPAIIRPSFTLGGEGGGTAFNLAEFRQIVEHGLRLSPVGSVLIEESVLGWKEFELEVVRDGADNCIIVCSIENIDPMGIHTGDSITVAPALTLTDKEYQQMRRAAFQILRAIGVDTGGSNVQFAVDPKTGRQLVIEMNPRVSRSSALASKATGFPIAKIAALLAVGYTLDELTNDITQTPAAFEPTLDYIVTKIPRFSFAKFPGAEAVLGTSMKSVGEVMAIGRSFAESLQKALRGLEIGVDGLELPQPLGHLQEQQSPEVWRALLSKLQPERLLLVAEALRQGVSAADVAAATCINPWFIQQLADLVAVEGRLQRDGLPADALGLRELKSLGFSDTRLAKLTGQSAASIAALRQRHQIQPAFRRIDSCSGELRAHTAYFYSSYEPTPPVLDVQEAAATARDKVVIIGSGPNRIGQGIEFDYSCVQAVFALKALGLETVMINCNPETVSTDYDTADRLYFEPITAENVLAVLANESLSGNLLGVIVQLGGQTPLKLTAALQAAGIPILGTPPDAIDVAEDRDRFRALLDQLHLQQPPSAIAHTPVEVRVAVAGLGYPVLLRPSYVLGGQAMRVVQHEGELEDYLRQHAHEFADKPLLIDRFLRDAIEVDVDVLADGESAHVAGVMEHIEEAGIHSGDSCCALPAFSLSTSLQQQLAEQAKRMALALGVKGLMNVQFAIQLAEQEADSKIYVLEANPRASRTMPFVAKATGIPLIQHATRLMLGAKLSELGELTPRYQHSAVKEAVFPYHRFPGVDVLAGPEMRSTGEVMGIDRDFPHAFAKAQLAAGQGLPVSGKIFLSVKDTDKAGFVPLASSLLAMGFTLVATGGTAAFLAKHGLAVTRVNKVLEGRPHIVDSLINGDIALVINTTESAQAIADSFSVRRTALMLKIPHYTTLAEARAVVAAIAAVQEDAFQVFPLQRYLNAGNKS
jgi:carbamoyl-phosphate synthase large subunit